MRAGKEEVLTLLQNQTPSIEETFDSVLACVKKRKLSTTYLAKIARDAYQVSDKEDLGPTVGSHVRFLVELSRKKLDQESIASIKDGDNCASPGMETSPVSLDNRCGDYGNEGRDTVNCNQNREGDRLEISKDGTVCVSITILQSLVSKIEALTKLVLDQKEEILDVEKRLKMEYKQRENAVIERMKSLVMESQYASHPNQVGEQAAKTSRRDKQKKKRMGEKSMSSEAYAQCQVENVYLIESEGDNAFLSGEIASLGNKKKKLDAPVTAISIEQQKAEEPEQDSENSTHMHTQGKNLDSTSTTSNAYDITRHRSDVDNSETWSKVTARRPKRSDQRDVHSAAATKEQPKKPLGKLLGAERVKKQVYFVGGINPDCTSEDIENFCRPHCPLLQCRIVPSRRYGTQAARLTVAESNGQLLETLSWPTHCYIRRWNFQTSQSHSASDRRPPAQDEATRTSLARTRLPSPVELGSERSAEADYTN